MVISSFENDPKLADCERSIAAQSGSHNVKTIVTKGSGYADRQSGWSSAPFGVVVFLDSDCELPDSNYLNMIALFFEEAGTKNCLAGSYISRENLSYLKAAYNNLCASWVAMPYAARSASEFGNRLLGGVFALVKSEQNQNLSFAPVWGGEESLIVSELKKFDIQVCFDSRFSVYHNPSVNFRKTLKRAWAHGVGRAADEDSKMSAPNRSLIRYWIQATPLKYWPAQALHFSVLILARLSKRVVD